MNDRHAGFTSLKFDQGLAEGKALAAVRLQGVKAQADTVQASTCDAWKPADRVVVNGRGMGQTDWGGFAQKARRPEGWLPRLLTDMTTRATAPSKSAAAAGPGG